MFGCWLLESCYFPIRDSKVVDPHWRNRLEVEEGEAVIRIYCMRQKINSIFKIGKMFKRKKKISKTGRDYSVD